MADRCTKLERDVHRALPRTPIRITRILLSRSGAAEREVRAAALLIGMTEMA
jgi:hypothetical protein